jgi:hypothetical protein
MAALNFRRRQTRRWWYAGATFMAAAFFAVFFVVGATADNASGCDFAATGTTESCVGPLSGSTFAGGDGNLLASPTTFGTTDWQNVSGRNGGTDLPSGNGDNSFGQGTKEDNASVTVVTGSIPPQKSDLTRFYEASEFANGSNFLYLAWERTNNLGSANMDFEINQQTQPDLTTTGAKTLNRTAGDLLVTFDFTNGGGKPTLGLLTWLTAAHSDSASDCFSSNALPCWGKQKTLNATISEGAVNNLDAVTDPIAPNNPRSLPALTFGEAAINLTTAGVFPANTCEAFGSVFLKSRSSSSFPAEVKDFVAPVPVNISNCGTIIVRKVAQNGNSTFGYSTTGGLTPPTFTLAGGSSRTYGPGTVLPGNYTVNEPTEPSGWTFVSLDCSATTGNGTTATQDGTTLTKANITIAPGGIADCTYTNHHQSTPSISTSLSSSSVEVGTAVHDSSTLTNASINAGGTVTYTVYTDTACSQGAQSAGTKTVTNGVVPDSNPITFDTAGDYYWQAVYSGDTNNNGATSLCTSEHLVVNKANPSASTAQHLIPNDDFTLSGGFSPTGTITFNLYAPDHPTCSGTPALTQTVTVSGNGTYNTTNTTFVASTEGTWRWQSSYSGDGNNNSATSACGVERFTIANS